jgi:hypothetical protein
VPSFLGLVFRTLDAARWGAGKGARLVAGEVDDNFWTVDQAIKALTENPTQPKQIQSITVAGNQMTITLSDGVTQFGPFTLPTAAFNVTGPYQGSHVYARFDLFTANEGMYLVLQPHTSLSVFNPADGNVNGPYYYLIFPFPTNYDVGFFFPGNPGFGIADGAAMFTLRTSARTPFYLPASLTGSTAGLLTASDNDLSFPIYQDATQIGTIDFASGATAGTFDFPDAVQFTSPNALRVLQPTTLDAAAFDLSVLFAGTKGLV